MSAPRGERKWPQLRNMSRKKYVEKTGKVNVRVEWNGPTEKKGTWTVVLPKGYVVLSHRFDELRLSKESYVSYRVQSVKTDRVVAYYRVISSGTSSNRVASWLSVNLVVRGILREHAAAEGILPVEAIPSIDELKVWKSGQRQKGDCYILCPGCGKKYYWHDYEGALGGACDVCHRRESVRMVTCDKCNGEGHISTQLQWNWWKGMLPLPSFKAVCPDCRGEGVREASPEFLQRLRGEVEFRQEQARYDYEERRK